jgi:cytochrome c
MNWPKNIVCRVIARWLPYCTAPENNRDMTRVSANKAIGYVLVLVATVLMSSPTGSARQTVSVADGVYAERQAERVRPLYKQRCAACHGDQLQGASAGSPLTGADFLANWSGRPLSDLVDKIKNTMPFDAPGSLSRQDALDLTAHILQTGKFPAGRGDLTDASLAAVRLPTVRTAAAPAAAASSVGLPPPVGNLAELMRAIAFYNSNIIFNLPVQNPATAPKKLPPVPFDYVKWGETVYTGWLTVDQASVALSETAPLLLTPGRRCQNGRPVPVDRADWKKYVDDLVKVGNDLYAASKARKYETLLTLSDNLNDACANCHKVYRDRGGLEGSGANRCEAAP